MTVAQTHRLVLTLTLVLPVLGLVSGSTLLFAATIAYFGALAVGFWGLHDLERGALRTWMVHGVTLVGLIGALAISRRVLVDAGLIIVMLGVFNRYLLRAGQRDDLILVGAAGVLLAAATVITPGFIFAVLILCFVPVALWTMLTASILGLAERGERGTRARLHARYGQRPVPRVAGSLTMGGLGLMVVGYVAVSFLPRYRFAGFLAAGGLVNLAGAGPSMSLGTGGVGTSGGERIALRVDSPRPLEGLYARAFALDTFGPEGFFDGDGTKRSFAAGKAGTSDADCLPVDLRRMVQSRSRHPVVVLGRSGPTAVRMPPNRRLDRWDSGSWVTHLGRGELSLRYEACLDLTVPADLPRAPEARAKVRARFLQLPDTLSPAISELSARLVEGAPDDETRVARVLAHFDAGFRYSLEALPGQAEDPLERFLFEAKAGHCELYAGAVVALLRSASVPSRVAAGYYGGWYNRRSRSQEFGSEDAHAWVEVLIGDRWRWVDATPPTLRARRSQKRFAWFSDIWDALEAAWYEYVIDFDEARRRALVGEIEARLGLGDLGGWGERSGAPPATSNVKGWPRGTAVVLAGLALVGVLVSVRWLLQRRSLGAVGRRLRGLLDAEGTGRPLARGLASLPAGARGPAQKAVALYEAARFGPAEARPPVSEVRAAVQALVTTLRAQRRSAAQTASSSSG